MTKNVKLLSSALFRSVITIGCDPEVFVQDVHSGEFLSSYGLLPGNKQEPYPVANGAIQIDGMACEFNTTPATTREQFVGNVQSVFDSMCSYLPRHVTPARGIPVAHFSPEIYSAQPPEALELGCEPDYNAYTGEANPRPDVSSGTMRTAAGHVHIGFLSQLTDDPMGNSHRSMCNDLVKYLDATVGVSSLLYDKDVERRALYGAAGAYRPKAYGVEYRVLSNAWLRSPELIGDTFDRVVLATKKWQQGARLPEFLYEASREIINESRFDEVEDFIRETASA